MCCCGSKPACFRPLPTSAFDRRRAQLRHAVADDVDHDAARDLARAGHAVGEHGQAGFAVDENRVLIVGPHHTRMRQAGDIERRPGGHQDAVAAVAAVAKNRRDRRDRLEYAVLLIGGEFTLRRASRRDDQGRHRIAAS
jgi:hypothetical protein